MIESTRPGKTYIKTSSGIVLPFTVQGPPEKEPTEEEFEIGDAIGRVFGQLLLREANVPRTRNIIYALKRAGYKIEKIK